MTPADATTIVLVDGPNVRRSLWPNIPASDLVERCRSWAEEANCDVVVVFDGRAPGGLVGERELDERCTVVGTGSESADEWIERAAERHAAEGRAYWLVTSDRALREAAGRRAGRVIGGGAFARELTS